MQPSSSYSQQESSSGFSGFPQSFGDDFKFDNIKQILIRLTIPSKASSSSAARSSSARSGSARRRGGSSAHPSSGTDVSASCNVAVWTSDDRMLVTSQSCPLTSTGPEIVPGSQVSHLWESRTGQCLLGIPSAQKPCPVLVSHPSDPSILPVMLGYGLFHYSQGRFSGVTVGAILMNGPGDATTAIGSPGVGAAVVLAH